MGQGFGATHTLALAVLLSTAGCNGNDVWVGQLQEGLNVDACTGSGTTCNASVGAEPLVTSEPRRCDAELGAELTVDFTLAIDSALTSCEDPGLCGASQHVDVGVAPDGQFWVLGSTRWYSGEEIEIIWLEHFDSTGALLSVTDVAAGFPFNGGRVEHEAQREHPAGAFAEEREAIAVEALWRTGDVGRASKRLRAMLLAYPRSSYRERLTTLIARPLP